MIWLRENDTTLKISHSSIGKVNFNKLITIWGTYYKISANLINVQRPYDPFIRVNFSNKIPDKDIPSVDIYFTSEDNSHGMTMFQWKDGKRIMLTKLKGWNLVEVQPKKIIKIKTNKCQNEAFYRCLHAQLMAKNYSLCPRKCMAISTFSNLPSHNGMCQTVDEFKCALKVTQETYSTTSCLPSCTRINFDLQNEYNEDSMDPKAKYDVVLRYYIASTKMESNEEYLIQDFVGMLGSIGGTLGMCIGFSFVGLSTFVMDYIQNIVQRKLTSSEVDVIDEKVIKVESKDNVTVQARK